MAPGAIQLLLEDGKSLWTEAARRGVDDAPERLVRLAVVGGRRKPKQGKGILDFQALIEADIADERIRDARPHQCFFEQPAQRIAAVENGNFVPGDAFCPASHDLRHDLARFQLVAGEIDDLDRSALRLPRVERLAESRTIERDDRVGSVQDVSCAPEILLESDLRGPWKVLGEATDVSDVRASEALHALVIVADREQFPVHL